jgi:hypothetical protein
MSASASRLSAALRTEDEDEETPLLGRPSKQSDTTAMRRLNRHFSTDVSRHWADAVLLFGYISTGLLDSSAVFIWGSFVSMQTGE